MICEQAICETQHPLTQLLSHKARQRIADNDTQYAIYKKDNKDWKKEAMNLDAAITSAVEGLMPAEHGGRAGYIHSL